MRRRLAAGVALAAVLVSPAAPGAPASTAPSVRASAAGPTEATTIPGVQSAQSGPGDDRRARPGTDARAEPSCARRSTTHPVVRLSGATRFATAACVSTFGFPDGSDVAVLARGDEAGGLADALAGTVLAHDRSAPVLLTEPTRLPGATRDELVRLDADEVVVLGGQLAVSEAVATELRRMGITVTRLAGPSREDTAARIAAELDTDQAFVVNGRRPADALVAGPAAARSGGALLLVERDRVPEATATALEGMDRVTIVGGPGVVGESVGNVLRRGAEVRRLGGASREETAATVARVHPGGGTPHLVAGADANLVDAIAAGWLGARDDGGAIAYLGRDGVPNGTDRWLRLGGLDGVEELRLLGGEAAVSSTVVDVLEARLDEAAAGGPPDELRGIWVHLFDDSLKSRAGIESVLDAATTANLNTVVVQVARRSDAFYTSQVIPRTSDPMMPADLDLLAELLPAAHARGLEVHAWFSLLPSDHGTFEDEVLPPDHVNVTHGPDSSEPWTSTVNLDSYDYLDPAIPGVQEHVVSMVREVAATYDVDGIHLDYLRYAGMAAEQDPPMSEHPVTEARYTEHGRDGESKHDFMAAQVQDLARRIRVEVADVAPDVVVSAALIAQGPGPEIAGSFEQTRTWLEKAQGWPAWIEEGLVDHAYPMLYFDEDRYGSWFASWRRFAADLDTGEVVMAPGIGAYLNDDADTLAQARVLRDMLDGVMIYSHQSEGVDGGTPFFRGLADGLFDAPAGVPDVPGVTSPSTGHLLVTAADGDLVTVFASDGTRLERRADATGHAGFIGLAPGTWRVVHGGNEQEVGITAGSVTRASVLG